MAKQQVKFHSVTEGQYKAIGTPNEGGLYFISDNGEIRKGSHHITGTRVYTAVDSTNGATPLNELTILLNGNPPGANDQPKKGDILIVDQTLKPASSPDAGDAIIAKAAYAHNGTDWEACDGNVDASKVILTSDILMAGNYDKVGNLTKQTNGTATFATGGKSVADALQEIFTKKLQPSVTNPAVTLNIGNQSQTIEVGETSKVPTYSASLSAGSYTYGPATGITATSWSVSDGTNTYTKSSGNLPTIVANDGSQSYNVTATATHGAGATPHDNIGGTSTVAAISAGSKSASKTVTVTGYRKWFYGVDTDGTGEIDSAFIRGLTNGGNCETAAEKQFTTGAGAKRIIVAIPKVSGTASVDGAKTLKNVILVSASSTPIPDQYVKQTSTVDVNDASGNNPIPYEVWIYKPASISPTEIHKLVVG